VSQPPSPNTRIATAPASGPIRGKPAPDHGSRGVPFGMDTQRSAHGFLACVVPCGCVGPCGAMVLVRHLDTSLSPQVQIMRPFCQV
jgi:hypothetical protein